MRVPRHHGKRPPAAWILKRDQIVVPGEVPGRPGMATIMRPKIRQAGALHGARMPSCESQTIPNLAPPLGRHVEKRAIVRGKLTPMARSDYGTLDRRLLVARR